MEELPSLELQMLINNDTSGFNYQQPRHEAWTENYELYRDKVKTNRLIQRQSVNMPLMKTVLTTLMKDIDEMPLINFVNRDNDKEAEVFQNEYWDITLEQNNAELQDIVDKKQNFFFGRTFDDWQISDGKIKFNIDSPEDIYVSRYVNPYDIDSSRFLIHKHIFKPLSSLANDPDLDQVEIKKLIEFFKSKLGLIKAEDNNNSLQEKNKKMADLGVTDIDDPILGETYVELAYHYVFRDKGDKWKDNKTGKEYTLDEEQIVVYLTGENRTILMKKPQEEIIGTTKDKFWRNHYRYNTWADDIDRQDFWTDGKADVVRTPNKVLNAFYSQLVENRTLRNFGMTFFDSSLKAEGFVPNTFQPQPFGFYPVPGKPSEVLQRVEIPDLKESLPEMQYITDMVEKSTGATPGQQGINPPSGTPLGTTQIVEGEAKARTKSVSKFYTLAWKRRALLFLKLIEASSDKLDAVKIYKKGRNTTDVFPREITPKDWITKSGYEVKIWSQDEKDSDDSQALEKLNATILNMPDNPKLREVYQRKLLEFANLPPDEVNEIMDFEKKKLQPNLNQLGPDGMPIQPAQPMNPMQQQQPSGIIKR